MGDTWVVYTLHSTVLFDRISVQICPYICANLTLYPYASDTISSVLGGKAR